MGNFRIQVPIKDDIPSPSKRCTPLNNNHGSGSIQQNHFIDFSGIPSPINTVQKQPTPPKGTSFINLEKSSFITLKQGIVTTTKGKSFTVGVAKIKMHLTKRKMLLSQLNYIVKIPVYNLSKIFHLFTWIYISVKDYFYFYF